MGTEISRLEIKAEAKGILSSNYWPAVCAALIVTAVTSAISAPSRGILTIFLSPLYAGLTIFYLNMAEGRAPIFTSIFTEGFDGKYYLRRVGGYAWMMLFITLWSLLLVIPGIVKSFSYSLTPYILAKYPEVPAQEALNHSKRLMNGRKYELFVLELSFIGWGILSTVTFGIVGIFYVMPYVLITNTLWSKRVMEQAIQNGEFVYNVNSYDEFYN